MKGVASCSAAVCLWKNDLSGSGGLCSCQISPCGVQAKRTDLQISVCKVAALHLPKQASRRRKLGFPVPLGSFLRSEDGAKRIEHMFLSAAARKFFREDALQELLHGYKGRNANRKIWAIYVFLVWYHIYFPETE